MANTVGTAGNNWELIYSGEFTGMCRLISGFPKAIGYSGTEVPTLNTPGFTIGRSGSNFNIPAGGSFYIRSYAGSVTVEMFEGSVGGVGGSLVAPQSAELNYIEYAVNTTTNGVQCPFDLAIESSGGGFDISTEGELGILNSGRYRIDYNCGLGAVDQDIELKVNGITKRTHRDGSISNREKPVILDLVAGDVITVATGTAGLWYGTTGSKATDKDYCRIIVEQLATAETIGSSQTPVNDQTNSGYFDIGSMRQQWGEDPSITDDAHTITFPAPFSSPPNVVLTVRRVSQGGGSVALISVTNTEMVVNRQNAIQNSDGPSIMWQAIGLKP